MVIAIPKADNPSTVAGPMPVYSVLTMAGSIFFNAKKYRIQAAAVVTLRARKYLV